MYRGSKTQILASIALLAGLSITLQTNAGLAAAPAVPGPKAQGTQCKTDATSASAHLARGKDLVVKAKKTKNTADMLAAKKELRTAIRLGRGNAISKEANAYMMANVPKALLSPRVGEGTELIAARLGMRARDRGIAGTAKPKIYEFYADWCEPCKMLKPVMAKLKAEYGDRVEFAAINVDDKVNAEMLEQYDVSPIPTVIFMNTEDQVVGYSIGFGGEKTVQKEVQKLLPVANKT